VGDGFVTETRAVFFTAPGCVEIRRVPLNRSRGQILVRSRLQGISAGTELLFYRGGFPAGLSGDLPGLSERLEYPLRYGYSNVGIDEEGRRVFGFQPHQEAWYSAEEDLILLKDAVSDDDGVFIPNLETALGIVQDLGAVPGETVAVAGLGVVGLLVAEVLRLCHYGPVILLDVKESRRKTAEELGMTFVNPAAGDFPATVENLTEGRGVDRGVNVSGSEEGLQSLIDCLGQEGTVVEASWYGDRPAALLLGAGFHRRRLSIKSSQVSRIGSALGPRWTKERRMATVLDLLERIRPGKYITRRFPLSAAGEAYSLLAEGGDDIIGAVFTPGEDL
jgi:threonine dehydrogenase-like Zn-dependent dehydrogenase